MEKKMSDDGSNLNEIEKQIRDDLQEQIKPIGTIVTLKLSGNKVDVRIISPNDFDRVANILGNCAGSIAKRANVTLNVTLATSWVPK